jgi:hypothetical protein
MNDINRLFCLPLVEKYNEESDIFISIDPNSFY